jgi:hypothetical protein
MTMRRIAYIAVFVFALSAALASFGTWGLLPSNVSSFNLDAAQESDFGRLQKLRTLIENEIGTPSTNDPNTMQVDCIWFKAMWARRDTWFIRPRGRMKQG